MDAICKNCSPVKFKYKRARCPQSYCLVSLVSDAVLEAESTEDLDPRDERLTTGTVQR